MGGLYAVAGRSLAAADAAADAAVSAAGDGGGGAALDLLQRQLDQRLTEFTLPNGLRFLVYQRHAAPIVSFHTYADVGAFDEVDGQTGALRCFPLNERGVAEGASVGSGIGGMGGRNVACPALPCCGHGMPGRRCGGKSELAARCRGGPRPNPRPAGWGASPGS